MRRSNQGLISLYRSGQMTGPGECTECGQESWQIGYDRGDDADYVGFQCRGCGHLTSIEGGDAHCPCCTQSAPAHHVLDGTAGWKLVQDTHSEHTVGRHVIVVEEWQCASCAPYAHSSIEEGH